MKTWQYTLGMLLSTLAFTLLVACGPCGDSSETDTPVDPPTVAIEETATSVEKADEAAGSPSEEIQPSEEAVQASPEPTAQMPRSRFDPENTPDGMVMVYVPQGKFEMGTSDEQRDRLIKENVWDDNWNTNEQPVHTVYLDAFWIDQTEVTNRQYALCVADGACQELHSYASATRASYYGNAEFADFPVVFVEWPMAEAYCAWAGRRLPTEAEWEKAARGTDGRTYPWGEGIDSTLVNYGRSGQEDGDTTAVGSYPEGASPYGAVDMAGNVGEWVADEYDNRYYHNSPSENPPGPTILGKRRVIRGGSWDGTPNSARAAERFGAEVGDVDFPSIGFRCGATP